LSFTIWVAWSAMAEHSIPYTCLAPACRGHKQMPLDDTKVAKC
jgi:hypothetical protein